jgi:hypothetical protein
LRLSSKIFLASALVIGVLAGVSALSLGAVGRLVSVNREITTHTIPALALTASARDAIPPLLRLEARALVLRDRHYAKAWTDLAAQVAEDLERLADYPLSGPEAMHRREASAALRNTGTSSLRNKRFSSAATAWVPSAWGTPPRGSVLSRSGRASTS